MKFLFIFIIIGVFSNCTNYEDMLNALETKQSLDRLKKGMKVSKVIEIIGVPLNKSFTEDSTEVWIYVTSIPQTAFSQSAEELTSNFKTAVIFKDKVLIGWGDEAKDYLN